MIRPIRSRRSFDRLRRNGVRVRIDPLWCSYVPDPQTRPVQVAFALGRAFGTAVHRNRLRRRLRALLQQMELPPGLYLFGAHPSASTLSPDELRTLLVAMVRRLPPPPPNNSQNVTK